VGKDRQETGRKKENRQRSGSRRNAQSLEILVEQPEKKEDQRKKEDSTEEIRPTREKGTPPNHRRKKTPKKRVSPIKKPDKKEQPSLNRGIVEPDKNFITNS